MIKGSLSSILASLKSRLSAVKASNVKLDADMLQCAVSAVDLADSLYPTIGCVDHMTRADALLSVLEPAVKLAAKQAQIAATHAATVATKADQARRHNMRGAKLPCTSRPFACLASLPR